MDLVTPTKNLFNVMSLLVLHGSCHTDKHLLSVMLLLVSQIVLRGNTEETHPHVVSW